MRGREWGRCMRHHELGIVISIKFGHGLEDHEIGRYKQAERSSSKVLRPQRNAVRVEQQSISQCRAR